MPALQRKPLGEGNTYADEVMRAWDRMPEVRRCRVCGCTEHRACVDDMGKACAWVGPDLCSACPPAAVSSFAEPLPIGTLLISIDGEQDQDADDNDRVCKTGANALGAITDFIVEESAGGFTYDVIFAGEIIGDTVSVRLESKELRDAARYAVPAPDGVAT